MFSGVDYDWFWSVLSKFENFDLKWDLNPRPFDWYRRWVEQLTIRKWYKSQHLNSSVGRAAEYESKGGGFKSHFRSKFLNFDKTLQNQS